MADNKPIPEQARVSPGAMLKAARESTGLSQREAADLLNWMPGYVAIMEQDDYLALRRPTFARGYVKVFGRLLALNEETLMSAFNSLEERGEASTNVSQPSRTAYHRQKTGAGVLVGLGSLALLIAALWWWQGTLS